MRSSLALCALGALVSRAAAQASPGSSPQSTPIPIPQTTTPPAQDVSQGYVQSSLASQVVTFIDENQYQAAACTNTALCTVIVTEQTIITVMPPPVTVSIALDYLVHHCIAD